MFKRYRALILFVLILFLVGVACNLPFIGTKTGDSNQTGGTGEAATQKPGNNPLTIHPKTTPTEINSKPVGIQEGLGSLDSYSMKIHFLSTSSKGSKTETNETVDRNVVDGNSHSITEMISRAEGDTEDSTTNEDIYSVGLITCTKTDETWDYAETTDQDKEMTRIFKQMVDFMPLINDPTFVGKEEINGISTNHFSFQVNGIGKDSGSVATKNLGDYWVAIDGQYMVKYELYLEVHSAAAGSSEAEVSTIEASLDLTNINQPINISLPSGCAPSAN